LTSLLSPPPCQPNYGEALAAKLAVSMASSHHLDLFILEGYSQVVIFALHNPSITQDWRISSLILKHSWLHLSLFLLESSQNL